MTPFQILLDETTELVTPIAVKLVDELTGQAPHGPVQTFLDLLDGTTWRTVSAAPVRTPSGILAFPELERRKASPASLPSRRYRFRVEADFYRPDYLLVGDGLEFDAFPYNDAVLPTAFATSVREIFLLPSPGYPFPPHLAILRGVVRHQTTSASVAYALVQEGGNDRVLSDERGEFALPLRQVAPNIPTLISAQRQALAGNTTIVIPAALGISHTITII